ncbi:hypothetical protein ZIOFF_072252 [Zingiber officinale]|uniref:Terpene synthase metal-binding domain-containing protein n=1 Tax=Zingiber officinale TaxID=94328 RepID=A0A8J5ETW2_ZINOF|nr:hypothetical protein ZIOFF_072252 [Zingiber officinale]
MPRGRTISISVDDVEEVGEFTTKHLKNLLEEEGSLKPGLLREQVAHALELPLNWRFQRLHAKWFIGAWQRDPAMDPALLLLAKWDVNAIDKLPEYMKLCFLAVFNTVNDAGYEVMRNKGVDIIPYLKRADELARGDVQKAVQCCMHERKVPEAVAREHIKQVMEATWRVLNGNRVATSSFEEYFQNVAINLPRAGQFFYGKGDGYAKSNGETQKQVMSLLIEPLQL